MTFVYAQFANEDPGLVLETTDLTIRFKTLLMALINTRDAQGNIRFVTSDTPNIFPGSNAPLVPSFVALFIPPQGLGPATPGNPALDSALSLITKQTITGAEFDDATLNLLDNTIGDFFTPDEWIGLARDLRLNVPVLASVPEPASLPLLAAALAALFVFRRRKV